MPRRNADLLDGTAPPRTVASFKETDDCIGVGEAHSPVGTVKLSGPASVDTQVTIASDTPSAASVDSPVTVQAGTDSATVFANGLAPAANVTLSATLGTTVNADGPLEVRDPSIEPCEINPV